MSLRVLVVFIISPTGCTIQFRENMEELYSKPQDKEPITMYNGSVLSSFPKNNTSGPQKTVRNSSTLGSKNLGLKLKPKMN
jgi:hypothetical protein